jgi:protein involved in polysaccharide export with SLBB domain
VSALGRGLVWSAWLASVGAQGCASAPAASPPTVAIPAASAGAPQTPPLAEERHELAIGDVVAIEFPHRADLNEEVLLRTDGRITLPHAGTMMAAGLTPEELEAELRARYARLAYDATIAPDQKRYLLNADDVLDIRFQNMPALNATVQVRPDGRISLDLVKTVIAEGKTPEELEAELITLYTRFLQNPDLVVVVKQYTNEFISVGGRLTRPGLRSVEDPVLIVRSYAPRQVYVAGEVRNPGFVTYRPSLTAMQAVISSGGLLASAAGDRVVLLRKSPGQAPGATFLDLKSDLLGRSHNDVPLRAFDIVVVPKTRIATINQALDQYVYQLLPAARNLNFTFFYDLGGSRIP